MNPNQPIQPSASIVEPAKKLVEPPIRKEPSGIGKTIAIVILSLTTAAFAGLFVWKLLDWIDASTNLDAQISYAVSAAVLENETKMEEAFAEREKSPYLTFSGPADYGQLTFSYPKTWSVYVSADASNGGEYTAYMHPVEISPINGDAVLALRISIRNQSFDSVVSTYDSYVKSGKMTMNVVNINKNTSTANVYRGTLPNNLVGIVAVMKIRDKTAILQTDSELFSGDFDKILQSLTFNS